MDAIEYEFIADIFPLRSVTLFHGIYGSGKSYSVIKSLNEANIKPLYVNLDNTGGLSELECYNLPYEFMGYHDDVLDLPDNPVLVIDTLTRLLHSEVSHEKLVEMLESLTPKFTVIVIGHTADFVGKDGVFRDLPLLARNSAETLWLEKAVYKSTKAKDSHIEYNLHINKGRGNGGSRIIKNWMRDIKIKDKE